MGVEVEELRNANLLRERGDLLIQRVENLDEAETCFKKALRIARRFPDDERASDLCFACNLGIAHLGTMKWVACASGIKTGIRSSDKAMDERPIISRPVTSVLTRLTARATARTKDTSRDLLTSQTLGPVCNETPTTDMPTPQKSFLPVRTARSANIHPRSASSLEDSGLAVEYARETDLKPPGHRSLKAQKRELKAAAEAEKAWRGQAKTETQMRKLSKSWGPYATSGIPPEELLYMTRENMTHAWGPKPRNVDRPCQIREGIVTKRMRIDRALLSRNKAAFEGPGSKTVANVKPATFYKSAPLATIQDKSVPTLPGRVPVSHSLMH